MAKTKKRRLTKNERLIREALTSQGRPLPGTKEDAAWIRGRDYGEKRALEKNKQSPAAALDPDRRDAVLVAARKLEVLADALVTHSESAAEGRFEDTLAAISIVSSVARRQSNLAGVIVRALDGESTDSSIDLGLEAHNG